VTNPAKTLDKVFRILLAVRANRLRKQRLSSRSGLCRAAGLAIASVLFLYVPASAQTTYRDPGGAFTVYVPAGWQVKKDPNSNEVMISKGGVAIAFGVNSTNDGSTPPPGQVLAQLENQIRQGGGVFSGDKSWTGGDWGSTWTVFLNFVQLRSRSYRIGCGCDHQRQDLAADVVGGS
jgi:hypothetical protein